MQSTGRRGFWIPPEDAFENAPPGSTPVNRPPQEPPTPTRATTTSHRPPLPLPVSARTPQRPPQRPVPQSAPAYTTSQPSSSRHNGRTGQEYNRRQRRFETIFDAWSREMARLEEEHRTVTQSCATEDETKRAMDDFQRKAQSVFTRYNEEIEALQMSSSEPGSSQSEAEDDEDEIPARTPSTREFHFVNHDADDDDGGDEDEEEEEDSNEDEEGDSDNDRPSPSEQDDDNDDDSEEDEEEDVKNKGLSSDPIINATGSGDETDHSGRLSHVSVKSYQSSQGTNGSLGLSTPPPTEVDEDYRATRRRLAREARKADELAAALPQRLRSSTIRGSSPSQATPVSTRPAAMALFETLSSSPASISSVPPSSSPFTSRHAPRDSSASRPSPSIEDSSSRIEILRRNSSLSGSDRSLSRPRPSSNDENQLLRDQYEGWRNSFRDHSDAVHRNVEKLSEESKLRFTKEQQEKHARAQALFLAQQEKAFQQIKINRNRSGSAGTSALNTVPSSSHPRSGSFAMPGQSQGMPSSTSPTLQRGVHPSGPVPPSISPTHPLQSKQSQTFQMAATTSSQSSLHRSQSRTWLPAGASPSVKQTSDFGNRLSGGCSDTEAENVIDDDESDVPIHFTQHKGSSPITIPNPNRGGFEAGHRRTGSQIHTGASTASVTPRGIPPQSLRNSSSTTFSSGTQSTRSSGGWSGASGASSNTTVTSSDTPGSRRGSMGEKTFIPPTGLHSDLRKNSLTTGIPGSSPPSQPPRWTSTSKITSEGSTSTTHSPASTLSRASTLPHPGSSGVSPINIAPSRPSVQQWHAMAAATTANGSSPSTSSYMTPNSGSAMPTVGSVPRSTSAGPLGVGQSPNKTTWKPGDQSSPPIPIQTKPSGPGRGRSDSSAAGVSPPVAFGTTPRPSPPLKPSMSSSDILATVMDAPTLKSTPSISTFPKPPVPEFPLVGSRSASPSKLSFIAPKSSPAPAKITSAQSQPYQAEAQQPSPESETGPSRRETKPKPEGRRRPKDKGKEREEEVRKREQEEEQQRREKEAEEQRKREEDEKKRVEEEKERQRLQEEEKERKRREEEEKERRREEEEKERKRREELAKRQEEERKRREELAKRQEEERKRRGELAKRQEEERRRREEDEERERRLEELKRREEDLRRREEEIQRLNLEADLRLREEQLRRREEEVKRKEEEVARRVAEVAELNKQKEQEEQPKKQKESHLSEEVTPEVAQRTTRRKGEGQRKKGGKKSVDEHAADLAAIERERQSEEERRLAAAQEDARRKEAAKREALRREEERRMREEREEAERREREEQERQEREEQEREEQERQEREEEERQIREEVERRAREERERRAREEQERRERRDQERKLEEQARRENEILQEIRAQEALRQRRQAQQRQEEENRQAKAKLEEERRYRQYTASRNEEERERRQEEERRAAEARIREENDRMTEMFQARDRTSQKASNMPKKFADAWEAYDEKWKRLMSQAQTGTRTPLTFATVPWPVLNPPTSPEAITRNTVGAFVLSQWHSSGKNNRDRIREALMRWHPDRFESRFLVWVPEGDERDHVKQGVGNVTRSLNELLARESSSGAL